MIRLQRRTFDEKKRREIVYDIQHHVAQNFGPNIGHDYGGRLMAAWLDK